jgi:hypothetical protein
VYAVNDDGVVATEPLATYAPRSANGVSALAYAPQGNWLAMGDGRGMIYVYDTTEHTVSIIAE